MRMSRHEVYTGVFNQWFRGYCHGRGLDLFHAGRNSTVAMNLLYNPFIAGLSSYDTEWEYFCDNFFFIQPLDDEARLKLVGEVIQFAVDEYAISCYTQTQTLNGVTTKDSFYLYEE